ncbi:MAG: glycosyltransferase family 2 protein [Candidatus Methanoperedens sp.]|nr:glycosyltransferase family 2 protein [Candidatus Methanoperedens sp.]MCE8428760.1 glycosyltransferase family 2 protein [Candidatus Methanoperedens sp.]
MINDNRKISFCIPVYNGEKTIGRCIESILDLTYTNEEIIIVNDGSTDGTLNILKKYPVKVIDLEQNMGRGYARQSALEHASGKYVALLDADGFITNRNWAEKMLSDFTDNRIAGVFSLSRALNKESSIARYWDYLTTTALTPGQVTRGAGTGNTLIKKSVLDEVGGFDKRLRNAEDSDISEKISKRGYVFYYEPDCLMSREQPSTISEVIKKEVDYAFWHGKRAYYNNNFLKQFLVRFLVFLALPIFIVYCIYRSLKMYIRTKDFASFWFLFFKTIMAVAAPFILLSSLYKFKS